MRLNRKYGRWVAFVAAGLAAVLLLAWGMTDVPNTDGPARQVKTFTNPILPAPAQDPWMVYHDGIYYYCESRGNGISIRQCKRIVDVGDDRGHRVWTPPASGPYSKELWAPELHYLRGRWYIYFAADDGDNANHRMWVIASVSDSPLGPYSNPVLLETGGWAIDGTVLQTADDSLFFIWSGWPGTSDGQQSLYLAPMAGPTKVAGDRTLISEPTEPWERRGMPINEGPFAFTEHGTTIILYSASGSWTEDYCFGMLVHGGGAMTDASRWKKTGPVLAKSDSVWGVGHGSVVPSPDGRERWLLYHAKESRTDGWNDRGVRAQPFTFDDRGLPVFAPPRNIGEPIPFPSE